MIMRAYRRTAGLGTNWVVNSAGQTIDCDALSNFFDGACWGTGTPISALPITSLPSTGTTAPMPTPVDCTQFWNALTSSSCSLGTWTSSTFMLPILAVAGVLAFLVISRR